MEATAQYTTKASNNVNKHSLAESLAGLTTQIAMLAANVAILEAPTVKEEFINSLYLSDCIAEMRKTIDDIHGLVQLKLNFTHSINANRREMESIKALKWVNGEITGKNESERNAAMTVALSNDADYQTFRAFAEADEYDLQKADGEIQHLTNMLTAIKYQARLLAAQIEYLAE